MGLCNLQFFMQGACIAFAHRQGFPCTAAGNLRTNLCRRAGLPLLQGVLSSGRLCADPLLRRLVPRPGRAGDGTGRSYY